MLAANSMLHGDAQICFLDPVADKGQKASAPLAITRQVIANENAVPLCVSAGTVGSCSQQRVLYGDSQGSVAAVR